MNLCVYPVHGNLYKYDMRCGVRLVEEKKWKTKFDISEYISRAIAKVNLGDAKCFEHNSIWSDDLM